MKIKVVGAAGGEVTGSCYVVETKEARILVDCGMFQGGKKSEALNRPPVSPNRKLDAVLLTHGHLDHTGRLPLLAQLGYQGPVFATPAAIEMTALILRDSARIQDSDARRAKRGGGRGRSAGPPKPPLYTPRDAEEIISRMRKVSLKKPVKVAPGIQAMWTEAGHMLGSGSIRLVVTEDGREKRVVFSATWDRRARSSCASSNRSTRPISCSSNPRTATAIIGRSRRPWTSWSGS